RLRKSLSILIIRRPRRSTLFPYTTLFRSFDRWRSSRVRFFESSHLSRRNKRRKSSNVSDWKRALKISALNHERAAINTSRSLARSEEHTSELQSLRHLVCRLLLEKENHAV